MYGKIGNKVIRTKKQITRSNVHPDAEYIVADRNSGRGVVDLLSDETPFAILVPPATGFVHACDVASVRDR
jgi:hypothetical protein